MLVQTSVRASFLAFFFFLGKPLWALTHFEEVSRWYEKASQSSTEELIGMWSGRCFYDLREEENDIALNILMHATIDTHVGPGLKGNLFIDLRYANHAKADYFDNYNTQEDPFHIKTTTTYRVNSAHLKKASHTKSYTEWKYRGNSFDSHNRFVGIDFKLRKYAHPRLGNVFVVLAQSYTKEISGIYSRVSHDIVWDEWGDPYMACYFFKKLESQTPSSVK